MLLTNLVLNNFGAYRGRNVIELTPPSDDRPIILFGGLNGAGKTTILDALQLVMYGRRARCSGRGVLGYPEFLRRCINRTVPGHEGAGLELTFTATYSDELRTFHIHRSWDVSGSGRTRERLTVRADGMDTAFLSERWDEIVEELLPIDISSLFFFDGEKIEALADPDRAGTVIATAIETLLGVNLLDRLSVDLIALEKRKRSSSASDTDRNEIEGLEVSVAEARQRREAAAQDLGARQNELDRARIAATQAKEAFRRDGGELFEQRQQFETRRNELVATKAELQEQMIEIASGTLPLALTRDLLDRTSQQLEAERLSRDSRLMNEALRSRDDELLDTFGDLLGPDLNEKVTSFLAADRQKRADASTVQEFLPSPDGLGERVAHLLGGGLDEAIRQARKTAEEFRTLEATLEELDRKLAAVPSADAIADAIAACGEADARVAEAQVRVSIAQEMLDEQTGKTTAVEKALDDAYKRAAGQLAAVEEASRITLHAERVRNTLLTFRDRLMQRHLEGIEAAILDSLRKLLRKQSLVADIRINPESYSIELFDLQGEPIPTERLSAGERQLLAISLLWGLARVSGRQLPTAIDTPLGRLDGTHRKLLAERYFPFASHQVLLLSTDREITSGVLDELRPAIGRSYALIHDDRENSTSVIEGYFDEEVASVA